MIDMNKKEKSLVVILVGIFVAFVISFALVTVGCDSEQVSAFHNDKVKVEIIGLLEHGEVSIEGKGFVLHKFIYEGCEYLMANGGQSLGIAHKGNCSNKIHYHNR